MRRQTAAAPSYREEPGSEEDDEEFDPKPTRSGRNIKPPARYAQDDDVGYGGGGGSGGSRRRSTRAADEDAFEDTMMTSPIVDTPVQKRNGGRAKKIVIDPDEEEDDAEGEIELDDGSPPPKAYPKRPTRSTHVDGDDADFDVTQRPQRSGNANGRSTRASNRARSRHSSADAESYREASSASDEDEAIISPERDFDEFDDDDDTHSDSPRPRRNTRSAPTRSTRQSAGGGTRRSTRAKARITRDDSDEPKRTLRERPKVNYQLPPLDVSAEINEATIAAAANAGGASKKRGVGFAGGTRFGSRGGGLRGMPWAMGGGQPGKMTQSMGDPDTSDSVSVHSPGGPS